MCQLCSVAIYISHEPVKTTSGIITGKISPTYPNVVEYLGIRFGETTAGSNRFMPPKRYFGNDSIAALRFGSGCPQATGGGISSSSALASILGMTQSEDCLFVNVWTKNPNSQKKRPVLLWIYGGAFAVGDSSMAGTHGESIANNHDIVVVSFNYRINVFGFPGAPGLDHLNPGLLDQRMAVEWVRDNIAAFGGDPARITLFGESAGGSSVDYYAYAWAKDPIVNGFISQSGTAMMSDLFKPVSNKAEAWFQMSKKAGCGGPEAGAESLKCVQSKTVQQLQNALPPPTGTGFEMLVPAFIPTADEKTVFSNVYERARNGDFAQQVVMTDSSPYLQMLTPST